MEFNNNNYGLMKVVVDEILTSNDPQQASIACYDIGEFARFHGAGRQLLESWNVKEKIAMKL
jgi:hypothetical protein